MSTREELRTGVKIARDKPSPTDDAESKRRTVWDKIAKLEKRGLCLQCERRRRKARNIEVCSDCAKSLPSLKCCHCKIPFMNHKFCAKASKIYRRELCMSCASNWATHNCDPKLCRVCNQWSAWRSTSECDRCYDLLQTYGQPSQCEACNNNAAFDRGESARQRVNELRLCFLCTINYKKNDYYNRKLMMSMGQDGAGERQEDRHSDRHGKHRRSTRDSSETPVASDKSQARGDGPDPPSESLQQELTELKESFQNLKRKYAELQEENIKLKKSLKTHLLDLFVLLAILVIVVGPHERVLVAFGQVRHQVPLQRNPQELRNLPLRRLQVVGAHLHARRPKQVVHVGRVVVGEGPEDQRPDVGELGRHLGRVAEGRGPDDVGVPYEQQHPAEPVRGVAPRVDAGYQKADEPQLVDVLHHVLRVERGEEHLVDAEDARLDRERGDHVVGGAQQLRRLQRQLRHDDLVIEGLLRHAVAEGVVHEVRRDDGRRVRRRRVLLVQPAHGYCDQDVYHVNARHGRRAPQPQQLRAVDALDVPVDLPQDLRLALGVQIAELRGELLHQQVAPDAELRQRVLLAHRIVHEHVGADLEGLFH
ncbi:uncharacterized protein BcabD6B2_20130 [Babesia caballi]|uniref:Uncharacterized protein n=1 Tax=Babesia caballi TaxID=5871 RepID=A0AAV4LQW9_BABCB|nr:hypothetical protein BcabD6B2_20130 [Babesia caballi]